jgi:UDP-N-acetylglucosamine:LPS N-acetylglucosamine transferase
LLIPIPWVSHNEQFANAKLLKNEGLGEILEEADLNPQNFTERIKYMLQNLDSYKNKSALDHKELSLKSVDLITNEILKYQTQTKS